MRIAVCGPATLSMLQGFVNEPIQSRGYPFPGTSDLVIDYISAGHSVILVTTATDVDLPIQVAGPQLEIHVIPSRPRARARALDLFSSERRGVKNALLGCGAEVVHAHWTYEFAIAARQSKIPSLVTVHDWGPSIAKHNKHLYWFIRAAMQVWCLCLPGQLTAPTQYLANKVIRTYRRSCNIVPNGVDLETISRQLASRERGSVGMLNVGFSDRKNVKVALLAWRLLRETRSGCTLYLAGPGYEPGGPAHAWALRNECDAGVVFDGPIDPHERGSWYMQKEIFLHTSREESFGMVLIEAMAAGTPVIAGNRSGAVPEITQGAARLINIDDPAQIAFHLSELLDNPDARDDLAARGVKIAQRYDKRAVAKQYLSILGGLLAKTTSNNL